MHNCPRAELYRILLTLTLEIEAVDVFTVPESGFGPWSQPNPSDLRFYPQGWNVGFKLVP